MIKYIGSKRRLVPILQRLAATAGRQNAGGRALDLFTGTTRVAQAFKQSGLHVTAVDSARYSHVFARCYIETDARSIDQRELAQAIAHLSALPARPGYFTETFCVRSRYFQPFNGARIDAMRDALETDFKGTELYPVLMTSLIEAADKVDSTTGVQMAYVKDWAPRSFRPLELKAPEMLAGEGTALHGDALALTQQLGPFDVVYLDPPYNQHRYYTNYHVWETLVAWDSPEHYGVACKRKDAQQDVTKSVFNSRQTMPDALRRVVRAIDCELLLLSYNDESWIDIDELTAMCDKHAAVEVLTFHSARYVGARIGIHNNRGERVGTVGRLRNREYVVVAGERDRVRHAVTNCGKAGDAHQPR